MVRFSLPPSFLHWRAFGRAPEVVPYSVQRQCGHYEGMMLTAEPGVFDRLVAERRLLCADCRKEHMLIAQLAYAPRLRLHHEHDIWAVERLFAGLSGIGFHVVAWLSSYDDCMEWIKNTFAGRPYEIIDEAA